MAQPTIFHCRTPNSTYYIVIHTPSIYTVIQHCELDSLLSSSDVSKNPSQRENGKKRNRFKMKTHRNILLHIERRGYPHTTRLCCNSMREPDSQESLAKFCNLTSCTNCALYAVRTKTHAWQTALHTDRDIQCIHGGGWFCCSIVLSLWCFTVWCAVMFAAGFFLADL